MEILEAILKLVPYVAAGISVVHSDLSLGTKQQAANDALSVAVAGAEATLAPTNSALAGALGTIVSTTMNSVIAALHPSTTTVPAASPTASTAPTA